jgi:hypothetical protein
MATEVRLVSGSAAIEAVPKAKGRVSMTSKNRFNKKILASMENHYFWSPFK